MSVNVGIDGNLGDLEKALRRLQAQLGPKTVARVVNRSATSVRAVAVREVAKRTGYKQKEVRDDVFLRKANANRLVAVIDARQGRAKNLIRFVSASARAPAAGPGHPQKFRQRSKAKHRKYLRRGVRARGWRRNRDYKGTFIIRGRNNNTIVVTRKGPGRNSGLKSVVGPSIRLEFVRNSTNAKLVRQARDRVPIEIAAAIKFAKRKAGVR